MPDLWVPGAAVPSLEDFVERLHKQIERFASSQPDGRAGVEVELHDGSVLQLASISPEPGYGFITFCPHCNEPVEREEVVVPIGSIRRIKLCRPEEHLRFGFSPPSASA